MGFGGISVWQLLIILVIVVLLFGTGKLRSLGSDLGSAVKNFRSGIKDAGGNAPEAGDDAASPAESEPGEPPADHDPR